MPNEANLSRAETTGERNAEIIGVQYLRGIAAAAVVLAHASGMSAAQKYFGEELWSGWLHMGSIGVDLFFMISGFIIVIVSLNRGDLTPKITPRDFFSRRALRILPLMWLSIVAYAVLKYFGRGEIELSSLLRAMVLWPIGSVEPMQIWTLRQEAMFYLIFAATYLIGRRFRWLLFAWFLAPLIYAAAGLPPAPEGELGRWLRFIAHPSNLEFGIGALAGFIWLKRPVAWTIPWRGQFAACVAGFVAVLFLGNMAHLQAARFPDTIFLSTLFAPLLLGCIYFTGPTSSLGKLLGDASYAIYLSHPGVISALLGLLSRVAPAPPLPAVVFLVAVASILGGIIIHFLVERPLVRGLRAWARGRSTSNVARVSRSLP